MPYIYAQVEQCTETGLPIVRALFIEFPDDPGAWDIDDAYLFGSDIYAAPLMENTKGRSVYLPGKENWIDYQTGKIYAHGWNAIDTAEIPCIILVREGAVIPHTAVAQSTDKIDWQHLILNVYGSAPTAKGWVCLPSDNKQVEIELTRKGTKYELTKGAIEEVDF